MKKQRLTESEIMRKYSNIVAEAQEAAAIPQQTLKAAAQKVAQALTPEEQKQLQDLVAQVGKNPTAIAQAIGITPQDAQAAVSEGYVAEGAFGISPTLKGKILQALHLATVAAGGLAATGVISDPSWALPTIGVLALMATGAFWGTGAGQVADPQQRDMTPRPGGGSTVVRGVSRNPNQEFADKPGPLKK
jgi:hypothetical protein